MSNTILTEILSNAANKYAGTIGSLVVYGAGGAFPNNSNQVNMKITASTYGQVIPQIYGKSRVSGHLIWGSKITIANSHNKRASEINSFTQYKATLAIALCEGEIDSLTKIWVDEKLVSLSTLNYRLYKGSEDQMPEPEIQAHNPDTPAYRGLAYIVLEDFIFEDAWRIPAFGFEISKIKTHKKPDSLSNLIKAVTIIPGSGEFVYDTIIQSKYEIVKNSNNKIISEHKGNNINCNNNRNIADSILSLDQLMDACPNLEYVSLVVNWFGDNLNLGKCKIAPKVEYQHYEKIEKVTDGKKEFFTKETITRPDEWNVAGYNRYQVEQVSRDIYERSTYGGTVSDISVLRYLDELASRKLKICFYPMFFMDIDRKPWRGRVTGEACDIPSFFAAYNKLILYYAYLVKGRVNSFVIGSELVGITTIKDENNNFPAVMELVRLAEKVKKILGEDVIITYAADWSEYHNIDGYYHLDPLWSCEFIDVIGIDAYFPLEGDNEEEIIKAWSNGEGYDYYYKDSERKQKLSLQNKYAWKNIEHWWRTKHVNPDGKETGWVPKSKKIWFTEFGFPSVDRANYQPNVFYDPTSSESFFPRTSQGNIDFNAQNLGLRSTLLKWQNSFMVEQKFIWTWDARPYPFWPDRMDIWADGNLWETGHWINGKIGGLNLREILSAILGYDIPASLDVIDGLLINYECRVVDVIRMLQLVYDIKLYSNKIIDIKEEDLVRKKDLLRINSINNATSEVGIVFYDLSRNYEQNIVIAKNDHNFGEKITITLPIVMDYNKASKLAREFLKNRSVSKIYTIHLPYTYLFIKPNNLLRLKGITLKVIKVVFNEMVLQVTAEEIAVC